MNTNNTSNPPFGIGQRVVALVTDFVHGRAVKGNIYSVLGIKRGCKCPDSWIIDVGIRTVIENLHCEECGMEKIPTNGISWCWYGHFAPIEENKERIRYVAVSETLREKAEEVVVESCNLS